MSPPPRNETPSSLTTISGLLAHISGLPPASAAEATARVDAALARPAPEARAALGLLALDLAGEARGHGLASEQFLVVPDVAERLSA